MRRFAPTFCVAACCVLVGVCKGRAQEGPTSVEPTVDEHVALTLEHLGQMLGKWEGHLVLGDVKSPIIVSVGPVEKLHATSKVVPIRFDLTLDNNPVETLAVTDLSHPASIFDIVHLVDGKLFTFSDPGAALPGWFSIQGFQATATICLTEQDAVIRVVNGQVWNKDAIGKPSRDHRAMADMTFELKRKSSEKPYIPSSLRDRQESEDKLREVFGWMIGRWETPLYSDNSGTYQQAFVAKWINNNTALVVDTEHGVDAVQGKSANSHRVVYWDAETQQFRFWETFEHGTKPKEGTVIEYTLSGEPGKRKFEITYLGGPVEWTDTHVESEGEMRRLLLRKNWARPSTVFTKTESGEEGHE